MRSRLNIEALQAIFTKAVIRKEESKKSQYAAVDLSPFRQGCVAVIAWSEN